MVQIGLGSTLKPYFQLLADDYPCCYIFEPQFLCVNDGFSSMKNSLNKLRFSLNAVSRTLGDILYGLLDGQKLFMILFNNITI